MPGEITYTTYRQESFDKFTDSYSGIHSGMTSGISDLSNYMSKTGDDATGDYTFDTNTLVIDSVNHCIGIRTVSPEGHSLVINATNGNCLRLIYNDADSGPTVYTDFSVTSGGVLNISSSGNRIDLGNDDLVTTGGLGIGVANITDGVVNVGTGFRITNIADSGAILRGDGTNFVSNGVAALTKSDDTNVTLTLGGTPTEALVTATSLTLGWNGQLSVARGGTGIDTTTPYSVICAGTTATGAFQSLAALGDAGQVLTSNGAGALPTFQVSGGSKWTQSGNNIYRPSYCVGIQMDPSGNYILEVSPNITTVLNSDNISYGYPNLMVRNGLGTATIGNEYLPDWAMIGAAFVSSKLGDDYSNIGSFSFAEATDANTVIGGLFGANDAGEGTAIGVCIKGVTSASGNTYGILQLGGAYNYFAGEVGIQVDPSSGKGLLQLGALTIIDAPVSGYSSFAKNVYYDSGWKRIVGDNAALLQIDSNGGVGFFTAVSGAADSVPTWITGLYNRNDGCVGVNTVTPAAKFAVNGGVHVGGDSNPGDDNLIVDGSITSDSTVGTSAHWNTAYTHSQVAGGNSVHVSTTENTNWDTAYTHSQSNSQAHTDYLINNGNDSSSGTLTATNFILSSDRKLKTKIQPLSVELMNINYKEFELKSELGQKRFGVIAQDIKDKYPELVRKGEDGLLSVAYIDLMIREIAYLKNKVTDLENKIK